MDLIQILASSLSATLFAALTYLSFKQLGHDQQLNHLEKLKFVKLLGNLRNGVMTDYDATMLRLIGILLLCATAANFTLLTLYDLFAGGGIEGLQHIRLLNRVLAPLSMICIVASDFRKVS